MSEFGPNEQQAAPAVEHLEKQAKFTTEQIDRSWLLFTDAIRQEILRDPAVREILIPFTTADVNETLPMQALEVLKANPRLAALIKHWQDSLGEYLELPPVPDEKVTSDISNSGLYFEERDLIARRYRFARDIKMLSLMAEMAGREVGKPDSADEIKLPSGVELFIDTTNETAKSDLLNPFLWESRKQIKDRVYRVTVAGRTYILKEKKTRYHMHTKKGGHRPGNTSKEEVRYANLFRRHGPIESSNYVIDWETPLGCATFPDGFQFAIFEDSPALQNQQNYFHEYYHEYEQLITDNQEKYKDEFEKVRRLSELLLLYQEQVENFIRQRFKVNNIYLGRIVDEVPKKTFFDRLKKSKLPNIPSISFQDYAKMKIYSAEIAAEVRLREDQTENGFYNDDRDGFIINIDDNKANPRLRLTAFDFEYYTPAEIEDPVIKRRMRRNVELPVLRDLPDFDRKRRSIAIAFMIIEGKLNLNEILDAKENDS